MAETTIHHILDELAEAATDHRNKGGEFERLKKAYFLTDPLYVSRFTVMLLCAAVMTSPPRWSLGNAGSATS